MKTILLIEPDKLLAQTQQTYLERKDYKVVWRQTAESAVMALDEASVDVVVLELNLAVHNGVEFLYEMRSYSEWQSIPVILHTNVRKGQLAEDALARLNIADYLYKPSTTLAQLVQAIEKILQPALTT